MLDKLGLAGTEWEKDPKTPDIWGLPGSQKIAGTDIIEVS